MALLKKLKFKWGLMGLVLVELLSTPRLAQAYNPCDLTQDGACNIADVQCSIDIITGLIERVLH